MDKTRGAFEREHGYYACGVNGCILAERHTGVCVMPELTRQRSVRGKEPGTPSGVGEAGEAPAGVSDCSKPPSPPRVEAPSVECLDGVGGVSPSEAKSSIPPKQRHKRALQEDAGSDEADAKSAARRSKRDISAPERLGLSDGWSSGPARAWTSSPNHLEASPPRGNADGEMRVVRLKMASSPPDVRASAPLRTSPLVAANPLAAALAAAELVTADASATKRRSSSPDKDPSHDYHSNEEASANEGRCAKASAGKAAAKGDARHHNAAPQRRVIVSSRHPLAAKAHKAPQRTASPVHGTTREDAQDAAAALLGIGLSPPRPASHVAPGSAPPMGEGDSESDDADMAEASGQRTPPMPPPPAPSTMRSPPGEAHVPRTADAVVSSAISPPPPLHSMLPPGSFLHYGPPPGAAPLSAMGGHFTPLFLHAPPGHGGPPQQLVYAIHPDAQQQHAHAQAAAHAHAVQAQQAAQAAQALAMQAQAMQTANKNPFSRTGLLAAPSSDLFAAAGTVRPFGAPPAVSRTAVAAVVAQPSATPSCTASHAPSCTASRVESRAPSEVGDDDEYDEYEADAAYASYPGEAPPVGAHVALLLSQAAQAQHMHAAANGLADKKLSRRAANYKCGRCGQPKRGHTCLYRWDKPQRSTGGSLIPVGGVPATAVAAFERPRTLVTAAPANAVVTAVKLVAPAVEPADVPLDMPLAVAAVE